ncbi:uncharacterized protein LOC141909954 [Tubulanus polymorphus]|uniref:uncharacterized protein LOC141909954 n=1 Tax=Tubulanus polymorphus TaxID=672921 RepID=UPI003DA2E961
MTRNWITVGVVVRRTLSILFPFFAKRTITQFRIKVLIVVGFVFFGLIEAPYFATIDGVHHFWDDCSDRIQMYIRENKGTLSKTIQNMISAVDGPIIKEYLPVTLLIISNTIMIVKLRQIQAKRKEDFTSHGGEDRNRNIDIKATTMAISVVLVFIVFETPGSFSSIYHYIRSGFPSLPPLPNDYWYFGRVVSAFFPVLNSASNFFLYRIVNGTFRKTALKLMRDRCRRNAT